jgi:hypothetical protein
MGNKRKLGEAAAEPGKPAGEWGAFVTEAEQPLLAAATRSINAQSTVRQAWGNSHSGRQSARCWELAQTRRGVLASSAARRPAHGR